MATTDASTTELGVRVGKCDILWSVPYVVGGSLFRWFRRSVRIVTRSVSEGEAAPSIPSLTLRVTISHSPDPPTVPTCDRSREAVGRPPHNMVGRPPHNIAAQQKNPAASAGCDRCCRGLFFECALGGRPGDGLKLGSRPTVDVAHHVEVVMVDVNDFLGVLIRGCVGDGPAHARHLGKVDDALVVSVVKLGRTN